MRSPSANAYMLLAALVLSLSACAARQDNGGEALLDPVNSARQEFVADVQMNSGRVLLAVEGYDKALVARPGDAGLLLKKGQALLRLKRPETALEAFRLAQVASPKSAGAFYGAGQASERLGRTDEARRYFERAVTLAPDSWRARCHLGVLLMNQGKLDQAREQFLAALVLPQVMSASHEGGARETLLNNLAVAQVLSGDAEGAVATFRQAMRQARDPELSANNLGLLLVRLGHPNEALSAFRAAGNDARALNNLGYALLLKGEVARAQTLFEKALDLSPRYYETAGENLKQAVQGASGQAQDHAPAQAVQPSGSSAQHEREGIGMTGQAVQGESEPEVRRVSLSAQPGTGLRFGPVTLRDQGKMEVATGGM